MTNSSLLQERSELERREEFVANLISAAQAIDVETCEITKIAVNVGDPYRIYPDAEDCIGRLLFVTSVDLDDWVLASDLPEDKYKALEDRIEREHRIPTTAEGVRDILVEEHARAAAKLDEVIDDLVGERFRNVPIDIVRGGVRLALKDLGKQGTRQEARLERRFRAMEKRS